MPTSQMALKKLEDTDKKMPFEQEQSEQDHFKGKDPMKHIVEVQADGILHSAEVHGAETPGSLFAGADSSRETSLLLLLLVMILGFFEFHQAQVLSLLGCFCVAWAVWKFGRSCWLAWSRLERLHRVAYEEQQEIEHNRAQEREELKTLYQAKGFEGKLLDEVIDVLMADSDRLLRVMLQEEIGFRLHENEHPLTQGIGALFGVIVSGILVLGGYIFLGQIGAISGAVLAFAISSYFSTFYEKNRALPAIFWNLAIAFLAYVVGYYFMRFLMD